MTKLICLRGYPGSGKSTIAEQIRAETGAEIVNRDAIRLMVLGSYWTGKREDEERVTQVEDALVDAYLAEGVDVVVDATHLNPQYLRRWAKVAWQKRAEFEVRDVRTPVDVCKSWDDHRALRGERNVGKAVIDRMAKQWPMDKWPEVTARPRPTVVPYDNPPTRPPAIVVDIDGTLAANTGGRSPYDYTRVHEDTERVAVAELVRDLYGDNYVIVCSGRDDDCREQTSEWLRDNNIPYDQLLMRSPNDVDERGKLPDFDAKLRLFNEYIRDKYHVRFVLDDRTQVVELWRELGLDCWQVAEGNF